MIGTAMFAVDWPAVKLSVPPPALVTLSAFASTVPAFCTALKLSAAGATASAGGAGGGSTTSVTGIVRGEPAAPLAVTVTVAAPESREELEEDLTVLDATGPLPADEYERLAEHGRRVRRHGAAFP